MTEPEAKEKGCCGAPAVYAAVAALVGVQSRKASGGMPSSITISVKCITSECMAWRWGEYTALGERTGYCGLAGKED